MKARLTFKWIMMTMLVAQLLFASSAMASDDIRWSEVQKGTYSELHPYTLNWTGNVLDKGGLNLSTMKMTEKSKEADIVINQYGSIGANGILLLEEDLEDPSDRNLSGFSNSLTMKKGDVYLVVLHDGTYAKIRIDRYLPDNGQSIQTVHFSYVLESESEDREADPDADEDDTDNKPNPDKLDTNASLSFLNPKDDLEAAEASYEFQGGPVTLPWSASSGHVSWDLYRSDNGEPYVKMTDFRLTEPKFTDNYVFDKHIYVYRFIAYNSIGEQVYLSPPVKVTINKNAGGKDIGGSNGNNGNAAEKAQSVIVLKLNSKSASVNGKLYTLDVAPFDYNGRTVVPLRFVTEALGAKVVWSSKDKSVSLTKGSDVIILYIDKSEAVINGKRVNMDVPAIQLKGNTFVPIRFVSENFNQDIQFDNKNRTITIKGKQGAANANDQKADDNKADDNKAASDYFIGKWSMWVPGAVISTKEGGKFMPGADADILTIYKDGTYTYTWNGKLLSEEWEPTASSDQITLLNYKFESNWKVTKTDQGIRVTTPPGLIEDGTRAK